MSFTKQVLLGLIVGVFTGIFFGEAAAPLKVAAIGFVKLLQMTVLPYVVMSIIGSLGALSHAEAKRLGLRVGAVIMALWAVALGFAMLIPLSFPSADSASFFSTSLLDDREEFNFVELYIPSNPFHALANNVVPAIVLFSVVLGVALIGVPEKRALLDQLQIGMAAVSRATKFVVRLTPFGVFAIAAHASGTLPLHDLQSIQVYLLSYIAIALLLALWVLPGLVSALTPISIRAIFGTNRDALVMAFVAADIFIILPSLIENSEQLLKRHNVGQREDGSSPEVIVPASFNFPHSGKLLSLSFVLFAGWLSDAVIAISKYPQFLGAGLLSVFGSLNAAIPFLLDLFRIPADTFQLYLATGVLNARFGSLLAAVHVIAVALLGSTAIAGGLRFQPARLVRFGVVTLLLTVGVITGLKALFHTVLLPTFEGGKVISEMQPLTPHAQAVVLNDEPAGQPTPASGTSVFDRIRARGILRVGFLRNRIPFAYLNSDGNLVGFDVEAAHMLASDFDVKPQFVPLSAAEIDVAMATGRCDIVMSGTLLTPKRQSETLLSNSYLDETLSFAALDHRRNEFTDWDTIRRAGPVRIGVPNLPYYLSLMRRQLPRAIIIPYELEGFKLDIHTDFDAYVLPAEFGSAQTLLEPKFSIVVPSGKPIKMPIAYPLALRDERWAQIVNTWIELRQKDGSFDRLFDHWILGRSAKVKEHRWSIAKDVLHWLD